MKEPQISKTELENTMIDSVIYGIVKIRSLRGSSKNSYPHHIPPVDQVHITICNRLSCLFFYFSRADPIIFLSNLFWCLNICAVSKVFCQFLTNLSLCNLIPVFLTKSKPYKAWAVLRKKNKTAFSPKDTRCFCIVLG